MNKNYQFLSSREIEVVSLIAASKSADEIGRLCGITRKTVETHRSNAMRKLDIHDLAALTRYVLAHGWISNEFSSHGTANANRNTQAQDRASPHA